MFMRRSHTHYVPKRCPLKSILHTNPNFCLFFKSSLSVARILRFPSFSLKTQTKISQFFPKPLQSVRECHSIVAPGVDGILKTCQAHPLSAHACSSGVHPALIITFIAVKRTRQICPWKKLASDPQNTLGVIPASIILCTISNPLGYFRVQLGCWAKMAEIER